MLPVAPIGILSSVAGGYIIEGSAYGSSGYLSWTPSAASSGYQYGVGAWVRRIKLGVDDIILSAGTNGNNYERLYFDNGDKLAWQLGNSGVLDGELKTTAVYRDVGAWMHVAIIRNGSTATLYVNGEAVTSYSTNNQPGATDAPDFGNTVEHNIWRYNSGAAYGYSEIARLVFQDETLPDIADLITSSNDDYTYPLDVSGLDFTGTNSFLLEGGTNVAAGTDSSGNGNDFTPSGTITATNDSPTDDAANGYGNYATINANQPNDGTFSNGNLTLLQSGGSTRTYLSTIKLPSTGKWRFKYTVDSGAGGGGRSVGILDFSTQSLNALLTGLANNWVYDGATGNKYVNGSGSAYGSTWTTGDSVEVLMTLMLAL